MAAFCAYSDVKTWLKLQNDQSQILLTSMVQFATDQIIKYLSNPILQNTYNETLNGNGQKSLTLCYQPIVSVTLLTINGLTIPAAPNSQASGYMFDKTRLFLISGYMYGTAGRYSPYFDVFTRRFQNINVQYTAGYSSTPTPIQQACIELVAYRFLDRNRIGEKTKTLGGQEVASYDKSDIPSYIRTMIDPFRLHAWRT